MYKQRGKINVHGQLAYAPQQPWIQNASIRDNITFGLKYDEVFYKRVVKICCLKSDFDLFPSGDLTEIGEKVRHTEISYIISF